MVREIPIHEKYCLTLDEAALYFGVGVNKLREIIAGRNDLVIMNGTKRLINKKKMEKYFDGVMVI